MGWHQFSGAGGGLEITSTSQHDHTKKATNMPLVFLASMARRWKLDFSSG
jgi:hypothetical protein